MNLPLNIDLQQVLLHLLNFTLLFAILYFLLYKPVKNFMDKRTEEYRKADEEAKRILSQAGAHEKEYADKLACADEEIRQKKAEARKEMNDAAELEMQKAREQASKIISSAKAEAENCRARMLSDAKEELSDMILEATEKIVHQNTSDAYDSFLDDAKRDGDKR